MSELLIESTTQQSRNNQFGHLVNSRSVTDFKTKSLEHFYVTLEHFTSHLYH